MPIRIESRAEPIPGYKLIDRLGGGGFGEVWRAEAPGGLMKAIKFVYGDLQSLAQGENNRAEQELKALARVKTIRHPFILSLERFDIIDGQLLIVMELADRSLWDRFRECRKSGLTGIPREELLCYMEETAEALDLMNVQYDLQHLDIKPQNLFLVHNHVKVADFGLVKDLEGLAASVTGGVTPVYAAPEVFDGWVSRFSDQYSLGIVFQELLTGVRPFAGGNTRQLILQHLQGEPDLSPLAEGDRPIVARALAKKPPDRYPTCLAFVEALRRADKDSRRLQLPDFVDLPQDSAHSLMLDGLPLSEMVRQGTSTRATHVDIRATVAPGKEAAEAGSNPVPEATGRTIPVEAKPENRGEGILFPSLVVGLGGFGHGVLAQLRRRLENQFGGLEALPHLSLLALDTDPEAGADPERSLTLRLSRPSRYLRPRDTMPPVEDWLDPKMVYRIPRSLVTTGVRALGRLAFIEHRRTISSRLRRELECLTTAKGLHEAAARTGLGIRSDWPRVYVVTSLSGGAGSGMFIDLAYLLQGLLREFGYAAPEIVGLFLLPPADDRSEAALPLANTYAALVELNHFQNARQPFTARYEAREPKVSASGPPFSRCILLASSLAASSNPHPDAGVAGEFLFRELATPVGRLADLHRFTDGPVDTNANPSICSAPPVSSTSCWQSLGVCSLSWPWRELSRRCAARLCHTLVEAWSAKDLPQVEDPIRDHMQQFLEEQGLTVSSMYNALLAAAERAAQMPLPDLFQHWLTEARTKGQDGLLSPANVRHVLQRMTEFLGSPGETPVSWQTAVLPPTLREAADAIIRDADEKLVGGALQFLETPGYRLAGAEEAVRQGLAALEERLRDLDARLQQLTAEQETADHDLQAMLADCEKGLPSGKRGELRREQLRAALEEELARLPGLAVERAIVERLVGIHLSLRGRLSDQMKELGFCRRRLSQLQRYFDPANAASSQPGNQEEQNERLLLSGTADFEDAVVQALRSIPGEALDQLDAACQARLEAELGGMRAIAAATGEHLRAVAKLMRGEAERFVEAHLPRCDAAELLLERLARPETATDELLALFDEALPELASARAERELTLCAVPNSPAGKRLAAAFRAAIPAAVTACIPNPFEIVVYREKIGISLASLPQVGSLGKKGYEVACSLEHFTPHSRQDISAWSSFPPAP